MRLSASNRDVWKNPWHLPPCNVVSILSLDVEEPSSRLDWAGILRLLICSDFSRCRALAPNYQMGQAIFVTSVCTSQLMAPNSDSIIYIIQV